MTANRPEAMRPINLDAQLQFACHPGVSCFTQCCRLLELALTPYDVLRLRKGTGLSSQELLDQYLIEEIGPRDAFPSYYLTMVDDGQASCVFVGPEGCRIYPHRPGACRAYPLGRAFMKDRNGRQRERYVVIQESHCQGFKEDQQQPVSGYLKDQELDTYNRFNDPLAGILQHQAVRDGKRVSQTQRRLFTLALYNLDQFRIELRSGALIPPAEMPPTQVVEDDEQLLLFAMQWLPGKLFPHRSEEK